MAEIGGNNRHGVTDCSLYASPPRADVDNYKVHVNTKLWLLLSSLTPLFIVMSCSDQDPGCIKKSLENELESLIVSFESKTKLVRLVGFF